LRSPCCLLLLIQPVYVLVFFFQAEDGIRDGHVTGVQTCALPISRRRSFPASGRRSGPRGRRVRAGREARSAARVRSRERRSTARSEERRVGKECRSRWSPYHEKKKREDGVRRDEEYIRTKVFALW